MFVIVFWGACHRFPLLWVKLSLVVICAQRKVSATPFLIHSCSHFLDVISWTWLLASSLVKGSVLSLMESGLIWKMCLQTCLQMDYISHMHWPGRPAREGTITWRESYTLKWRKGAESQHAFIALCFLILDVIWLANSNSCCLQIHAMMNYFWNCESEKKNVFSIKSLLLVCFFNHSNRKRNQNNLFLEKDKIRHPEESVYLSLYPSRRKKKVDIPEGTELPRIYQWWTSKLAVN